jgi:hypothetical protein
MLPAICLIVGAFLRLLASTSEKIVNFLQIHQIGISGLPIIVAAARVGMAVLAGFQLARRS